MDARGNPYVGPRTFTYAERDLFFGREREARELLARVISERLVLFYAQSGAGKSSLINARLVPQLREAGFAVLPVGRVSGRLPDEVGEVENIFLFNLMVSLDQGDGDPALFATMDLRTFLARLVSEDGEHYVYDATVALQPALAASGSGPVDSQSRPGDGARSVIKGDYAPVPYVLIIDQFEELLISHLGRWSDRADFFRQLNRAMADDPLLWVVLTLREDYVAALDPYAPLMADRLRARFYMQRLEVDAALEAVERPAAKCGRPFASGVAQRLVDDLRRIKTEPRFFSKTGVLGPHVEPVQLQVVCSRLWESLPETEDVIRWEAVEQYGDIDRALTGFYEAGLAVAMRETGVTERDLRRWFGTRLITPMGTRGLALRGARETEGLSNAVVDVLERARIIRADVRAGARWYELVHDRLLEPIVASNKVWRDARETPLRATARRWEATQDPSLLYRGTTLEEASAWAEANPEDVEPYEEKFLEASQQAREERARRRRWYAIGASISAVVLVIMALLTFVAFRERGRAQRQARQALARQLAAQSQAVLTVSPRRGLLLAVEALQATLRAGEPRIPAAENALRQALADMGGTLLTGHEAAVGAVAFSPDGHWLATGSVDGTARLWPVDDPTAEPLVLRGHEAAVEAVAFSPDGRWLATGSEDLMARLWSVDDLTAASIVLRGHEEPVVVVTFSPDGRWLATASWDGTARLWPVDDPTTEPLVLRGHEAAVKAVTFSHHGRWLATGSEDHTARLWALDDPTAAPLVLRGHEDFVVAVTFSLDEHWLATGSWDGTVRLWDLYAPMAEPVVLRGHWDIVTTVAFNPDGGWLATGSGDGTARLWDMYDAAAEPVVLHGHEAAIGAMAFSPDGRWLATGSEDRTARLWEVANPTAAPVILRGHEAVVRAVAFSPDGRWLASGSEDHTAQLWDADTPTVEPLVLRGHAYPVEAVAFSPDGRWLASGSRDRTVRLWSVDDPTAAPQALYAHDVDVMALAFGPNGRWLATGSLDSTARLWKIGDSMPEPVILYGHEDVVKAVAFSPDGRWLATGSWDHTARLWAVDDPTVEPLVLRGHEGHVEAVAFSPDGRWLATGGCDNTVRLWSVEDPTAEPVVLRGYANYVYAVAFSPDGHWLATGSDEAAVRLWSVDDPDAEPVILRGHEAAVHAVAFSPDGRWLAAGSEDHTARLWSINDPDAESIVLRGHNASVQAVAFSPDGARLATGSEDNTVRLWRVSWEALLDVACRTVGRNLTREAWGQYLGAARYRATCVGVAAGE